MADSKIGFFITDFILLIVFLGLIKIIFGFNDLTFLLELFFTIIMLFISFTSLIPAYSGSRISWGFLAGVFVLILLNLLVFVYLKIPLGEVFLLTLLFAIIGFIVCVWNIKKNIEERKENRSIISVVEKPIEKKEEKKETVKKVYTNFNPGKYVASAQRTVYHAPKCDWANNIKRKNRIWFSSSQEAKRKGYKPHEDCIKKE